MKKTMLKEWKEEYSLNHTTIDRQHQELFELAQAINLLDEQTCCKEALSKILKKLFEHMREHFQDEESYMLSFMYPKFEMHQQEHEKLVNDITTVVRESKSIAILQKKVKEFSDLMVMHVIESDMQIEKWRKMHAVNLEELEAI